MRRARRRGPGAGVIKARSFRVHHRAELLRVASLLSSMLVSEEKPLLVEVSPYSEQRTSAQNRFLHALLRDIAEQIEVDGRRFSAEAWKEQFRRQFIGTEEVELPRGGRIERGISTTTLDVGQMSEALDRFQSWLASEFGYLPEAVA
jgi:hypothetical protein